LISTYAFARTSRNQLSISVLNWRSPKKYQERMARQILGERQFNTEIDSWLREVRANAYVVYPLLVRYASRTEFGKVR
jgi:hypothetical protein